jgi:hypothetical protein
VTDIAKFATIIPTKKAALQAKTASPSQNPKSFTPASYHAHVKFPLKTEISFDSLDRKE